MITLVKNFLRFCEEQNRRKLACKKYVIRQKLTDFFEDLQISTGETNVIPACTLAKETYKRNVKCDADVNRFYKKLLAMGVV